MVDSLQSMFASGGQSTVALVFLGRRKIFRTPLGVRLKLQASLFSFPWTGSAGSGSEVPVPVVALRRAAPSSSDAPRFFSGAGPRGSRGRSNRLGRTLI
ncbi:uncharacterized protein PG986_004642 [Apiospora aurea]|uniref:Uncharacterized protein n=1 Tax=Apiospora aurea TaxID=335848 RepID=A0ABR1QN52_9PEZI